MPNTASDGERRTADTGSDGLAAGAAYRYARHVTLDSEQHAESLTDWDQTYSQVTPGHFRGEVVDMAFLGMQVFRETTNRAVTQHGCPMSDCYVVGVPLAMSGPGLFSRQQFGSAHLITLSGQETFSLTTPEHFDVLAVAIPTPVIRSSLELETGSGSLPAAPTVLKPGEAAMAALRNCLGSMAQPAEFDGALLRNDQIQRIMGSAVLNSVVSALASSIPAVEPNRSFKARSHLVKQIVDWVMAKPDDTPTIAEICLKFKISRRLLNYSFQEVLGTNPLNYLRSLRLNAVRRELRRGVPGTSVRDVAAHWGFWHLPRFSNEYRKLFGELPSETLRANLRPNP